MLPWCSFSLDLMMVHREPHPLVLLCMLPEHSMIGIRYYPIHRREEYLHFPTKPFNLFFVTPSLYDLRATLIEHPIPSIVPMLSASSVVKVPQKVDKVVKVFKRHLVSTRESVWLGAIEYHVQILLTQCVLALCCIAAKFSLDRAFYR